MSIVPLQHQAGPKELQRRQAEALLCLLSLLSSLLPHLQHLDRYAPTAKVACRQATSCCCNIRPIRNELSLLHCPAHAGKALRHMLPMLSCTDD